MARKRPSCEGEGNPLDPAEQIPANDYLQQRQEHGSHIKDPQLPELKETNSRVSHPTTTPDFSASAETAMAHL
jgi:hypothetical protein